MTRKYLGKIFCAAGLAAALAPCANSAQATAAEETAEVQAPYQQAGAVQLRYDPLTEITVKGDIQEIRQYTAPDGRAGTDVMLKTDKHGTLDVFLGPSDILAANQIGLSRNKSLEVTGSRIGANVLLARTVKQGDRMLAIRNAQGLPLWTQGTAAYAYGRARNYNPATEVTVKGKVKSVSETAQPNGRIGTHVLLDTDKEGTLDVHLGPLDYLTANHLQFSQGDEIQVTGSRLGGNTLIARTVQKDGNFLALRNARGLPLWSPGAQANGAYQPGIGQYGTSGNAAYPRAAALPAYNPNTETTVEGKIQSLRDFVMPNGQVLTDVVLQTDKQGTLVVSTGPLNYLMAAGFQLEQGKDLKVVGSRSGDLLLARRLEQDDRSISLRTGQGVPIWTQP